MAIEILSPNYILPDNDVWLLKGVPLENNYENTIIWQIGTDVDGTPIANESPEQAKERQFNYFTATIGLDTRYHHIHLPAMTYLREGRKYLRVDLPYTNAIQYNYLIFKNNGAYTVGGSTTAYRYEHRYYYAFITKCEYLNDKTTIIHYEIDLLQTYNFDYALEMCLVEREHSATDVPGDNLIPEKIDVGIKEAYSSYLCKNADGTLLFPEKDWAVIVIASVTWDIETIGGTTEMIITDDCEGGLYNGIYSGLHYNIFHPYFPSTDVYNFDQVNLFLKKVVAAGKESAIASIITMPSPLVSDPYESSSANEISWPIYLNRTGADSLNTEWVYARIENGLPVLAKPRNKKLYTQPFTDLVIYNGCGEIATYGIEHFIQHSDLGQNKYLNFRIYSNVSANPEITCVPMDYKGVYKNFMEKLDISSFPQCAYTIDAYRAWLAQNKARLINTAISSGVTAAIGTAVGSPIAGAYALSSAFSQTAQLLTEAQQHAILPPQIKGAQTPYLSISDKEIGYKAYVFKPLTEYAKIIDDYFDLYGYATHKLKIPNRTVRPTWCYTKTVGCRLTSINRGIPADVDDAIRKIYDNGVRFWKNPQYIGDYSRNNQV